MKLKALLGAALLALAACTTTPQPGADQFEVNSGKALQEITLARQASTELAKAGRITWAQDDLAQAALASVRKRIEEAGTLRLTDPAQASRLLADALTELATYQGAKK